MAMTIIEKILSTHSTGADVVPGQIVTCEVDRVVMLDLQFVRGTPQPRNLFDASRLAIVLDHAAPAPTVLDADSHRAARKFAEEFGITELFDIGRQGISHQIVLEHALTLPGQALACADSHSCASGVLNSAARGLGNLEILQIICTGSTWYRVPETVLVEFVGIKPGYVSGKDVFLAMADVLGSVEGRAIEFSPRNLDQLSIDERSTIATMCAELSAEFAIFPADDVLLAYLSQRTARAFTVADADVGATYAEHHMIDLAALVPRVAKPGFVPGNTVPIAELGDPVRIDQGFIGSCANGKLSDLAVAAHVLHGRTIAAGVRLLVTPASQDVYLQAVKLGYVTTLLEAGAVVTNSTCGACYGGHMGVVGAGEVCITSSTRNFQGRMGSDKAQIYLAGSATVAASAVTGVITDPRPYLEATS
ncbi:MAG: aconitase/3-isopropylmalate dehydratase large subunit family protein [Ilumatobacteraceae bacterium]